MTQRNLLRQGWVIFATLCLSERQAVKAGAQAVQAVESRSTNLSWRRWKDECQVKSQLAAQTEAAVASFYKRVSSTALLRLREERHLVPMLEKALSHWTAKETDSGFRAWKSEASAEASHARAILHWERRELHRLIQTGSVWRETRQISEAKAVTLWENKQCQAFYKLLRQHWRECVIVHRLSAKREERLCSDALLLWKRDRANAMDLKRTTEQALTHLVKRATSQGLHSLMSRAGQRQAVNDARERSVVLFATKSQSKLLAQWKRTVSSAKPLTMSNKKDDWTTLSGIHFYQKQAGRFICHLEENYIITIYGRITLDSTSSYRFICHLEENYIITIYGRITLFYSLL